jgi:hypothetical protein
MKVRWKKEAEYMGIRRISVFSRVMQKDDVAGGAALSPNMR